MPVIADTWVPKLETLDGPIYRLIADAVECDICTGLLPPGTVLPTQRDLADRMGLGLGTVTRAYKEAERKGLIRGDRRRGTVVGPFDIHYSVFSELDSTVGNGSDLYLLPHGTQPPDLGRLLQKMATEPDINSALRFPSISEKEIHRQAGVSWLARLGYEANSEEILLSVGAHNGVLGSLASITEAGDYMVSGTLTYMGLAGIADFLRLRILPTEMDDEGILPDAFESWCKKRPVKALYCIPSVHNPTNADMSIERRKDLIDVAERYGVPIVEDNMLGALMDTPIPPMKALAPHRCFLVTSGTKVLCPGLKLGFVVPPPGSYKVAKDAFWAMSVRVAPFLSDMFTYLINSPEAQRVIDGARREGRARQDIAAGILPAEHVRCNPASYWVWIPLPSEWNSRSFADAALRKGVRVWPGDLFAPDPSLIGPAVRYLIGPVPNRACLQSELELLRDLLAQGTDRIEAADGADDRQGL